MTDVLSMVADNDNDNQNSWAGYVHKIQNESPHEEKV